MSELLPEAQQVAAPKRTKIKVLSLGLKLSENDSIGDIAAKAAELGEVTNLSIHDSYQYEDEDFLY